MHLEWNTETCDGRCRRCGGQTALIVPYSSWMTHEDQNDDDLHRIGLERYEEIEINEEISAHYCSTCQQLRRTHGYDNA